MIPTPARFLEEAERLLGCPFRLYGRDPLRGLDCVGLVQAALERAGGARVETGGYRLRNTDVSRFFAWAKGAGLVPGEPPVAPGDVIHALCGPAQHHLMIADRYGRVVHAHASLRRVVRQPAPSDWPLVSLWRLGASIKD